MDVKKYILILSRMSLNKLLTTILLIMFILFCGTNDEESFELYMNKLQKFSVHIISKAQKLIVKKYYLENNERCPNLEERQSVRKAFNS